MPRGDVLAVDGVSVGPERLVASVRVSEGHPLRTSSLPDLPADLIAVLPGIARHRCECGCAHGVLAEIQDTELAHLLEHVALELMALAGSPRSLRGSTEWDFAADGHGVFQVSLEYDDDLVALAALRSSVAIVNALAEGGREDVDVASVVQSISAVRSR